MGMRKTTRVASRFPNRPLSLLPSRRRNLLRSLQEGNFAILEDSLAQSSAVPRMDLSSPPSSGTASVTMDMRKTTRVASRFPSLPRNRPLSLLPSRRRNRPRSQQEGKIVILEDSLAQHLAVPRMVLSSPASSGTASVLMGMRKTTKVASRLPSAHRSLHPNLLPSLRRSRPRSLLRHLRNLPEETNFEILEDFLAQSSAIPRMVLSSPASSGTASVLMGMSKTVKVASRLPSPLRSLHPSLRRNLPRSQLRHPRSQPENN